MKKKLYNTEIEVVYSKRINHEMNIKAISSVDNMKFNQEINSIVLFFGRLILHKLNDLDKIRIEFFETSGIFDIKAPIEISKICHIYKTFDFENYFAQNKLERRKIILETMYESIKDMCQKLNYDLEPFTIAYEKVKDLDYINKFVYKKLTFSRNRKNKAGIEIETNEDAATISVLFTDRNEKPMQKVEILKTLPHDMFIYRAIHKGKWISPNEYQVSDSSGQVNFIANLLGGSTIKYVPKSGTQEKLKEAVNELNLQLV